MNENTKTPIELLTDMLAAMTARAIEAEHQRDQAKERADEWYKHYLRKDADHKETQGLLDAEIKAHQKTTADLEEAFRIVGVLNDELEKARPTLPAPQA